jgi:hypothetical protein
MNRGYNMGTRLIEDFLARTGLQRCSTFAETAEVISKVCLLFSLNPPSPLVSPHSLLSILTMTDIL